MKDTLHAFISSPVRGLDDDRRQIRALALADGFRVYVDEIDHPRAKGEGLLTLEDLFVQMRAARLVVVLLATPKHGSGIRQPLEIMKPWLKVDKKRELLRPKLVRPSLN